MEFKERLKNQRQQKGLSQQQLANAIFVSRSAVAKWENGLGFPNEASYHALLDYFELSPAEFSLNEEHEEIRVSKNKTIRKLTVSVISLSLVLLSILIFFVINAMQPGFALTSQIAAGEKWKHCKKYEVGPYDIYTDYFGTEGEWGGLLDFCVVKDKLFGYQQLDKDEYRRSLYTEGKYVGSIYSFPLKDEYLYVIPAMCRAVATEDPNKVMLRFKSFPYITAGDQTYEATHNAYFIFPKEIYEFDFKDEHYTIKSTIPTIESIWDQLPQT